MRHTHRHTQKKVATIIFLLRDGLVKYNRNIQKQSYFEKKAEKKQQIKQSNPFIYWS